MTTKPMQAGALRRRITIQQRPAVQDSYGFSSTNAAAWTTVLTTWAAIEVKSATALLQVLAGQEMPTTAALFTFRYPPSIAIKAGMRLVDGANTFTIQNVVDVDERHRTLQVYAVQAPAPGA